MAGRRRWAPWAWVLLLCCWGHRGVYVGAAAPPRGGGGACPPLEERMKTGRWSKKAHPRPRPPVFELYDSTRWFHPSRAEECGGLTLTQGDINWFRAKYRHPLLIGDSVTREFTKILAHALSPEVEVTDRKEITRKKVLYIEYSEKKNGTVRSWLYFRHHFVRRFDVLREYLKERPVPDLLMFNSGFHYMYPQERQPMYEEAIGEILTLLHEHAPNATFVWTDSTPAHNRKKKKKHRMKQRSITIHEFNKRARTLLASHPVYKPGRDLLMSLSGVMGGKEGGHYSTDGTHWFPIVDLVRTAFTIHLLREKEGARRTVR